jgi:hypothetical protein
MKPGISSCETVSWRVSAETDCTKPVTV